MQHNFVSDVSSWSRLCLVRGMGSALTFTIDMTLLVTN